MKPFGSIGTATQHTRRNRQAKIVKNELSLSHLSAVSSDVFNYSSFHIVCIIKDYAQWSHWNIPSIIIIFLYIISNYHRWLQFKPFL